MVGTAAMMVVLSAFNGLENLIRQNYDIVPSTCQHPAT